MNSFQLAFRLPACRYWLGWLCCAGLLACQPPESGVEKPKNLIPPDKMAAALTEIHVAEARVGRMGLGSADSTELVFKRLRQQIFARQHIDTATFSKSYTYYVAHPNKLETVYKIVVDTLEARTKTPNSTTAPSSGSHP